MLLTLRPARTRVVHLDIWRAAHLYARHSTVAQAFAWQQAEQSAGPPIVSTRTRVAKDHSTRRSAVVAQTRRLVPAWDQWAGLDETETRQAMSTEFGHGCSAVCADAMFSSFEEDEDAWEQ